MQTTRHSQPCRIRGRQAVLAAALLLLLGVAPAGAGDGSGDSGLVSPVCCSISGRVTDASTGRGIAGAAVTFHKTEIVPPGGSITGG